ncbi:MAG: DNA-primase RepB domain-containing protein [Planctomycetota bacterium]|jgi:hypothetical protein
MSKIPPTETRHFQLSEQHSQNTGNLPYGNQSDRGEERNPVKLQNGGVSTGMAHKELARYASCVFEPMDTVEVRRLPSGESTWHQAGELDKVVESLVQDNQQSQHIYVGANPRRLRGGTRSKDVVCARCLFVDFDGITAGEARDRWHNAGLPTPTITIASGHGVHAYWRLSEPVHDMDLWSNLQKRLIALLGSDAAIHDPARIMRLPGFTNHKEPVAKCWIIDDDQTRIYDFNFLMPLLYSAITESDYMAQYQSARSNTTQSKKLFHNNINALKVAKLTVAKWPGVTKGGRNCKAFQNAAYLLKNLGLTGAQAWSILQQWNRRNRPPMPEYELHQALRNANIYGRHRTEGRLVG